MKIFFFLHVNHPASLFSVVLLVKETISEPFLCNTLPLMHMLPIHQLSMAWGCSLHTQPSSAAVLSVAVPGAISLPILRVLLQVPPDCSEPVDQLESKMSWRLAEPAHHPPGTSSACTLAFTTTDTNKAEVHWAPAWCCWEHGSHTALTLCRGSPVYHQTISEIKPWYVGLLITDITDKEYSRLNCKNLNASKTC